MESDFSKRSSVRVAVESEVKDAGPCSAELDNNSFADIDIFALSTLPLRHPFLNYPTHSQIFFLTLCPFHYKNMTSQEN